MQNFDFYKKIKMSNKFVISSFEKLKYLYGKMPDTKGCLENISKEDGCGGWCCQIQFPQLFYSEFLYIWNYIKKNFDNKELCDMIEQSMLNAVKGDLSKGCIFFNKETKLCRIHNVRPLNCYLYGITPKEEFDIRFEKVKEKYKNNLAMILKEQCDLVFVSDGKDLTTEDTAKLWNELVEIEKGIGISEDDINDEVGGSYRSPHDHLLFFLMPDNVISGIAGIQMYDDASDKITAINEIMINIRKFYNVE